MNHSHKTHRFSACSFAVLFLLVGFSATSWGQGAPDADKSIPTSKVERLNRAPVSKEILQVKLPRPAEFNLENGLSVMILEDHRFPLVSVQFEIDGAGAFYEPANMPGLAGAAAQLLNDGTKTRTSKQIADQIDSLGAHLGAGAPFGSGTAALSASGLSDNFDQWFELATDVLLHPTFPADELAQYKTRSIPAMQQRRAQPNFLANQTLNRVLFGDYPAAIVSATPESVDALTPAILADWHTKRYVPQNTTLAIAGDVNAATLLPKLRKWLAEWHRMDLSVDFPVGPPPAAKRKIYLVDRPGSVQTTLLMGNLAIDRTDPDYPALIVMNEVLGAGSASRLFLNLREEKGYTYGVYSTFNARKYAGPWTAGGDLRTEVTDGAMTEFMRELNRIREEKVSDSELDAARHTVAARFALSLESPDQMLGYAVTRKEYNFPADYWDKYPAQIAAIAADDVLRVAKKYINPETMQIVAVGDASKIKSVMEKYGPVEMVDAAGKPPVERGAAQGDSVK
jgi:zinc protease